VQRTHPLPWEGPNRPGSFNDPRDCVELIPWSELEFICGDALEDAHVPIHLPRLTGTAKEELDMNWMLWRPPSPYFFDSHCLYTEDEVYQYCIENNWYFPGHMYHDKVVFACYPLKDSLLVDDFKNFWDRWARVFFSIVTMHGLMPASNRTTVPLLSIQTTSFVFWRPSLVATIDSGGVLGSRTNRAAFTFATS